MATTQAAVLSRLDDIRHSGDAGSFGDAFERAVADLGGTGFAMGAPATDRHGPMLSAQREMGPWLEHYHGQGLVDHCGFSRRTQRGLAPFTWQEGAEADVAGTQEVVRAAETFGLRHGLHVPVALSDGCHGAVFIQLDREAITSADRSLLCLYALAAHAQLQDLEAKRPAEQNLLSQREREVLLWFADGKSCEDVASIIGISPATVMFHYRNVARRFGTLNRTHTVVEALRRGAISLS